MAVRRKKKRLRTFFNDLKKRRLDRLEDRLRLKKHISELKNEFVTSSHSLLWVWEYSKKIILICFIFYVIVQVYSMIVMVTYCDFSYLGVLIEKSHDLVLNGIFAYLIKSALENVVRIWIGRDNKDSDDEAVG